MTDCHKKIRKRPFYSKFTGESFDHKLSLKLIRRSSLKLKVQLYVVNGSLKILHPCYKINIPLYFPIPKCKVKTKGAHASTLGPGLSSMPPTVQNLNLRHST